MYFIILLCMFLTTHVTVCVCDTETKDYLQTSNKVLKNLKFSSFSLDLIDWAVFYVSTNKV